jgi:hypothetical protein
VVAVPVPARFRRHLRPEGAAGVLAAAAGWVTGRVLLALPSVPGVAGAAMVSLGAGEFAGHVFGHGLAPWVGIVVGGVFALVLDRRI